VKYSLFPDAVFRAHIAFHQAEVVNDNQIQVLSKLNRRALLRISTTFNMGESSI